MKKYDLAYGKDLPRAVHWGKAMWIWEELRKEKPDLIARYFQAKREHADPAKLKRYTADECVAVMSIGHRGRRRTQAAREDTCSGAERDGASPAQGNRI